MNISELIKNSYLNQKQKSDLQKIVGLLGINTVDILGKVISRKDVELISQYIIDLFSDFVKYFNGFKQNNQIEVSRFWTEFEKVDNPICNEEDKILWLGLILDLKQFIQPKANLFSIEQINAFKNFEIDLFEELPLNEILFFLKNEFVSLSQKEDVLNLVKLIFRDREYYLNSKYSKLFSDALVNNHENIGNFKPKELGIWVREFINHDSLALTEKGTLQISGFIISQAKIYKLNEIEKNLLVTAFKLFLWVLSPEINDEQISLYKREKNLRKDQEYKMFLENYIQEQEKQFKVESEVLLPSKISSSQPNIDAKLKALKSRVSNQKIKS